LIHQDIDLYVSVLSSGDSHAERLCQRITFEMGSDRFAWIQVARGIVTLNGESLREGDGVQINSPELLELTTDASAEILLFDLA
jgi:quercetin 2,3-dioxygenase